MIGDRSGGAPAARRRARSRCGCRRPRWVSATRSRARRRRRDRATDADGVTVLDNGLVAGDRRPDDDGLVVPRRSRSGREVLAPGREEALLQLHPDLPVEYDAWDLDEYYRRQVTDLDAVDRIEVVDRRTARRPGPGDAASDRRRCRRPTSCGRAAPGSTCTSTSTGTSATTCSSWPGRSTCTPTT